MTAPLSRFSFKLHEHESQRHARLRETTKSGRLAWPELPPGWRPEDVLDLPSARGFLPLEQAAQRMAVSEEELFEQVEAGLLEALAVDEATLLVRPAIVSRLQVVSS